MKNRLVAHGEALMSYSEDGLVVLQAAVGLGFSYIEIDVQLSKQAVLIVNHDDNLNRTVDTGKIIYDLTANELTTCLYSYFNQPQQVTQHLCVFTLKAVINQINSNPELTLSVVATIDHISYEWAGAWQWGLYDIKDSELAQDLLVRYISLLEISDIVKLASAKDF